MVIWHGLGDNCCKPSKMGRVKNSIEQTTGAYVLSVKIGNTEIDDEINSFFKPVNTKVLIEMVFYRGKYNKHY